MNSEKNIPTWSSDVEFIFQRNNLQDSYISIETQNIKNVCKLLMTSLTKKSQTKLAHDSIHMPKLRTYVNLSITGQDKAYIYKPLSFIQRKSLAKFRLGVLPLRIETGRYEYPKLAENQRLCQICGQNVIENEMHFCFTVQCIQP